MKHDPNRPLPDDFAMYSAAGNAAVKAAVADVLATLPITATDDDLYRTLTARMNGIKQDGHGEVWDTDVRESMVYAIERRTGRDLSIYF